MYRNVALLVLIALTPFALGKPGPAVNERVRTNCFAKFNVDPAFFKGPQSPIHGVPPRSDMKCFYACAMKQTGMLLDDGTMNIRRWTAITTFQKRADQNKSLEIIKKCGTQKREDPCEMAHAVLMCLYKAGVRVGAFS